MTESNLLPLANSLCDMLARELTGPDWLECEELHEALAKLTRAAAQIPLAEPTRKFPAMYRDTPWVLDMLHRCAGYHYGHSADPEPAKAVHAAVAVIRSLLDLPATPSPKQACRRSERERDDGSGCPQAGKPEDRFNSLSLVSRSEGQPESASPAPALFNPVLTERLRIDPPVRSVPGPPTVEEVFAERRNRGEFLSSAWGGSSRRRVA